MASIGGAFAFERYEPLAPYAVDISDADSTQRLPAADRTLTDLMPVHEEIAAWIAEALERRPPRSAVALSSFGCFGGGALQPTAIASLPEVSAPAVSQIVGQKTIFVGLVGSS